MRMVQPGIFVWNVAIVVIVAVGVGMAIGSTPGIIVGVAAFVVGALIISRRPVRRWKTARRGLEPGIKAWFEDHVPQYVLMDGVWRRRFERYDAVNLAEWWVRQEGGASC